MRYFFTTRHEGNMGLHVGDDPCHVLENRDRLRRSLGVSQVVFMNQVHGDEVFYVDKKMTRAPNCDALITNQKEMALAVTVADCIPLLLYDQKTQSIGVAHAGREGTRLRIASKTVYAMQKHFDAKIEDIQVYMGASIQACCYEVSQEVTKGLEHSMLQKEGKYFLDLPLSNQEELLSIGIKKEHLHTQKTCTCCDKKYFSYRREKQTGRFVGVICL